MSTFHVGFLTSSKEDETSCTQNDPNKHTFPCRGKKKSTWLHISGHRCGRNGSRILQELLLSRNKHAHMQAAIPELALHHVQYLSSTTDTDALVLSIPALLMSSHLQLSFNVSNRIGMTVTLIFPLVCICWKRCASCRPQCQIYASIGP